MKNELGYNTPAFSGYLDIKGNPIKKTPFTHPYSYDEFVQYKKKELTGSESAVYSDRMIQWDYKKFNSCCQQVWGNQGQYFDQREPDEIERFLQLYFDSPKLELVTVLQGCNIGNGYPYWIFFFNLNNN